MQSLPPSSSLQGSVEPDAAFLLEVGALPLLAGKVSSLLPGKVSFLLAGKVSFLLAGKVCSLPLLAGKVSTLLAGKVSTLLAGKVIIYRPTSHRCQAVQVNTTNVRLRRIKVSDMMGHN